VGTEPERDGKSLMEMLEEESTWKGRSLLHISKMRSD